MIGLIFISVALKKPGEKKQNGKDQKVKYQQKSKTTETREINETNHETESKRKQSCSSKLNRSLASTLPATNNFHIFGNN